jgi:hypothetical protein
MLTRVRQVARKFFTSFVALWLVIGGFYFAGYVQNCHATRNSWDAIDRIVEAATNPPSRRGAPLTPEQKHAVAAYRSDLIAANGARPHCVPF